MPTTTRHQAANRSRPSQEDAMLLDSDIEQQIRNALQGVGRLRKQVHNLTQENNRLKRDLERLYEAEDVSIQPRPGKKGSVTVRALTSQVKKLERQVAGLEDTRRKDRKKIRKLQQKEIKEEALDLRGGLGVDNGIGDESEGMKKLLNRFLELMSSPSMEEREECAVCLSEMTLDSARSLPCQHVFCVACLPNIMPQNCPTCRKSFWGEDDADPVHFTATEQWDALLKVAADWAIMERSQTPDDVDEEESLPFIEDDEDRSTSVSEHPPSPTDAEAEAELGEKGHNYEGDLPTPSRSVPRARKLAISTPPDNNPSQVLSVTAQDVPSTPTPLHVSRSSYHESPSREKRRILEELATEKSRRARYS